MSQVETEGSSSIKEWSGQLQPALVATLVFLFCLEACLWVRNLRLKRRLPGPFAWPVVGNAMQLGQMPHITFSRLAKKYGNVYQIRLGSNDIVVLNGDKAIREALVEHSTEFAGRPDFMSFQAVSGGNSMTFSSYSKQWKMHRKIAQSTIRAFSTANTETKTAFEGHIVAEATELVDIFHKVSAEGQYFNPGSALTVAAANVICALCFGKRYGHDDEEFKTLLGRVEMFGKTVGAGSLVDVMPWLRSFPNPVRTIFMDFLELNHLYFDYIQRKVVANRETFDPEVIRGMSDAIIGVIEAEGKTGLSEAHTEGTVSDLIGAGLDTISTALHWNCLLLAKYPAIQIKLQEIIDREVGRGRLPTTEDRGALAYVDAFTYETMRYISFVPVTIPHSTMSDVTVDGLLIPKDTVVFVNQSSVNHDPLTWKDPHVFDPMRFLDKHGHLDKDLTNQVMIFSAGKRRCIGDQIAKVELFLFLSILIHQCHFENPPGQDLSLNYTYGLTLRPLDYKISAQIRGERLTSR